MTIRDFEIFIAAAETAQMSVAARELYITQPTVSHSSQPAGQKQERK